jgi:hypothetical protein
MSNMFTKEIGDNQFNFQSFDFGSTTSYHVDVKDEDGTRWEFRMAPDETNAWKLEGEKLPAWILKLKNEIERAINEHD